MSARWMLDCVYRSERFGMVIASFSNITLLGLLAFKASSSYGAYRNLMIAYTIVEVIYSFLSFWTEMAALSTDKAYVVFSYYHGYVDRSIAPFFLVDFCGIYFTLLLLLVVHFIYRYFVVCDFQKLDYFKGYRLGFWVVGCAISGFGSGFLKVFTFPENEQFSNELRDDFMEFYNLTMDQVVYNGPSFYVCDEFGECEKPLAVWATTLYLTAALFVSVFIMLFCGFQSTQKLNSAIPIVFMYIPIILLFMTPMFHLGFGPFVNFAMATIAIYPPIDQFAIIYVIRDFRNAIHDFFTCKKKTISPQASGAFTTSRLSVKSNI
ncbi:hypothetical protein B9Z55_020048 [Caenorhabditis nigoni]|uniref:G-protein coupled receptors family 1 profile domain-containing protein n=1 Tax=Caenorhabditis nigoni TaxID=1611254 RepID=A0A2G5TLJ0_9PELO|nr:hypothetical protein B9Z55_020048 [Caenorhabditis nigoni]